MTSPTAEATPPSTLDDLDAIPQLRAEIDTLDHTIASLVVQRAELSRRIQAARMSAGGTRVQLGREREILEGYKRILGSDGVHVGDAVLRICRGTG